MTTSIIGIDNGITGGVAVISAKHGLIIDAFPMPIQRARKGNEIDIRSLYERLETVRRNSEWWIEEPGGSKSAKAAASMAGSFHALRGMIELCHYRWHRITPAAWQKAMIPGAKGDTKQRALAAARMLWPDEKWLATDRCRIPHDGMIDAALIAEYGRRLS